MIYKKIATTIATGAVVLSSALPAFAAGTTLQISGNGSDSTSAVNVSSANTTTVSQSNTAVVSNNVTSNASTGGNKASDNTGGDTTVKTGDAANHVAVQNTLNSNQADVNSCGCQNGGASVLVSGNGTDSTNTANVSQNNATSLFQTNTAVVTNNVDANAKTGNNKANDNTGGDTFINSGNASNTVLVGTTANANVAHIGGGTGNAGGLDVVISGNGSDSDNTVNLSSDPSLTLVQGNTAVISNNVDADANSGGNKANDNTGGDTTVKTGDATSHVGVDNMVNFNAASADCGCVSDVFAKIAGNGTDSDNAINAELGGGREAFQASEALLGNDVNGDAKTGYNKADDNTGPAGIDPVFVQTGDSDSWTSVSNTGNANVFGPGANLPGNIHLTFDMNWMGNVWSWFM